MFRIGVVGLGKLGAPLAAVFASCGVHVTAYDVDPTKIEAFRQFKAPVDEPGLQELMLTEWVRGNLTVTEDISLMVRDSHACIFVLPTPSLPNGDFDHSVLSLSIGHVADEVVKQGKIDYIFIVASTVMPGFLRKIYYVGTQRHPRCCQFSPAYKPEFIALGNVIDGLRNPDMMLLGADDARTGEYVSSLYRKISTAPIYQMSLIEAELAKISLNCAITMKISFANQIGMIARKLGAEPRVVLEAVGADHRIGSACLRPGLPYGGPCFPRDNQMFARVAAQYGAWAPLANATNTINVSELAQIARQIPAGGDVGILGTAYKPGTSVTEESPGMSIYGGLSNNYRRILTHDPVAEHTSTIEEVLACPTVVVCTDWPVYRGLKFREGTLVIDPYGITGWKGSQDKARGVKTAEIEANGIKDGSLYAEPRI